MQKIDITGGKFGKLFVVRESPDIKIGAAATWECLCDCGKTMYATSSRLNSGRTKSCGCSRSIDLTGIRSGKLVAIEPTLLRRRGMVLWRCECDCGGDVNATSTDIVNGTRKSCGCIKRGRKKATQPRYKGVRQAGSEWIAFHPVVGDICSSGSEHDAACAVRDWLIAHPDFQMAWPLSGYPAPGE